MDEKLLESVNQAVHNSLMQIVRAITAAGMDPVSAVSLVRGRLDIVEEMARKDMRDVPVGATADGPVPADGGAGEAAEAEVVEKARPLGPGFDLHPKRRGQPTHPGETEGFWTDEDTSQYGIEPRTGPGLDPGQAF